MNAKNLIKKYLKDCRMMQMATVDGDQPWIVTVYYVEDEELNLYWLSLPSRRHSQEIARHPKIAMAIAVKHDKPVVGIQAGGLADVVTDKEVIDKVMKKYVNKYDSGKDFYNNFLAGKHQHSLYKFTPKNYVLFDEVNFSGDQARQEIVL